MPKEGFAVITIHSLANEKAHTRYDQKVKAGEIKNKSFSRYVNDMIMETIEADEALSLAAPHLEVSALVDGSILLDDHKLSRLVEVLIRGKERDLVCTYHKRNDCIHVGFAYAIPQVYVNMKKIKR